MNLKEIIFGVMDAIPALWNMVEIKTQEMFDRQLRSNSIQLFKGEIGLTDWLEGFAGAIDTQLTKAWNEGADEVGVLPEDMTPEDLAILDGIINEEYNFMYSLGDEIELLSRETRELPIDEALDKFRSEFNSRLDIWGNRYADVVNQAKLHFGGKTKLVWKMGATEKHCETCAQLDGIVAYAEEWEQAGIQPQSPPNSVLECGGWNCDCSLETTDARRSYDAFNKLLDIAAAGNL
jgi:hypothetical protein